MDKYLITGATGNIGRYVVEELLALRKYVKTGVHNIDKAKTLFENKENVDALFLIYITIVCNLKFIFIIY